MIQGIPAGYALRLNADGAPALVKVERHDEARPHISMEQALQQAENDAARSSDDYQEASQWLRTRSTRQALLELHIRLTELEKRLNDEHR